METSQYHHLIAQNFFEMLLKMLIITPNGCASCCPLERFGPYCFLLSAYMFEASC